MSDDSKEEIGGDSTLELICEDVTPSKEDVKQSSLGSPHHENKRESTPTRMLKSHNKDVGDPVRGLQLSQPFFVSDTMDDDASLIIPPTPADETVPFIIPSTPPEKENGDTIDESVTLIEEKGPDFKQQLLFDDGDEDDDWTKPTQPIFPVKQDVEKDAGGQVGSDDETFAETDAILDSCYNLPTQPEQKSPAMNDEKLKADDPDDDDWNLKLTATQSQPLEVLHIDVPESRAEEKIDDGNATPPELEETLKDLKNEEEERSSKVISPSNASCDKETTPEEVRLFAEIESIVKAAKASETSSNISSSIVKEKTVGAEKTSDEPDSDDDEIAPSQTSSRSVEINLQTLAKAASNKDTSAPVVICTELGSSKVAAEGGTSTKTRDQPESEHFVKDDGAETTNVIKTVVPAKNLSRLSKNHKKEMQASTTKESGENNLKATIVKAPSLNQLSSISTESMLPPPSTPQKKFLGKKLIESISTKLALKSGDGKSLPIGEIPDVRFNLHTHPKRFVGSFTDAKSLEKLLHSVGITVDDEELKSLYSPSRRFLENNVVKEKMLYRVFIRENKVYEEFQAVEEDVGIHSRADISPANSSSTTTSTKTSSFASVTSGEMGDISSSMSSKSLCSSASSQTEGKATPEMPLYFKALAHSSEVATLHGREIFQKQPFGSLNVADKVSSQDDFKNPVVMLSPMKSGKKGSAKQSETPGSLSEVKSKKKRNTRKANSKKEIQSSSESEIEAKRMKLEELKVQSRLSTNSSQVKSSSKKVQSNKKLRTECRKRTVQKSVPERKINSGITEEPNPSASTSDIVEESGSEASPFGSILPGVRVMARWKDGYYYPGIVQKQESDGRWCVQFDDGAVRIVLQENLLKIALLHVGTSVLALSPDGYYDPGIVSSHYREGRETGYVIEQPTGVTRRYQRASVILSTEQAKQITNSRPMAPPSLTINLGQKEWLLSLKNNVIGGKRKRKSSLTQSDTSKPPPTKSPRAVRRKNPDPNLDTTESSANESVVPQVVIVNNIQSELNDEDEKPLATRQKEAQPKTGKNKRGKKRRNVGNQQLEAKKIEFSSSDTSVPETSKKHIAEKKPGQDAVPIRSTKLFQGYAFLLSYAVRKNAEDDDSDPAEDGTFDKEHLCKLILSSGGLVFDTFEEAQKCSKRKVILLANTYLRTIKYIQCVAANIPCVQHHWVQNCYLTRKFLERHTYMLSTGYSLLHSRAIDWHGKTDIFKGLKIVITTEKKSEFVNIWTPVLLAAKADLVQKWTMPSFSVPGTSFLVDLIVTNAMCPNSILTAARRGKIPVVSSEYIIQCIIVGERLPHDAHPKFKHDFKE